MTDNEAIDIVLAERQRAARCEAERDEARAIAWTAQGNNTPEREIGAAILEGIAAITRPNNRRPLTGP